MGNNAKSDGPMVASYVTFSNNVQSDNFPTITTVPVGMPGNPPSTRTRTPPSSTPANGHPASRRY